MNGQMKFYSEKKLIANEFIRQNNPYEKGSSLNFDLRGYAAYVKENGLKVNEITPKIMNMFLCCYKSSSFSLNDFHNPANREKYYQ